MYCWPRNRPKNSSPSMRCRPCSLSLLRRGKIDRRRQYFDRRRLDRGNEPGRRLRVADEQIPASPSPGRARSEQCTVSQAHQSRVAGRRCPWRFHLGRAGTTSERRPAGRSKAFRAPRRAPSMPSCSPTAWRAAVAAKPKSGSVSSGARRAAPAICRPCSAKSWNGCCRSRRLKARPYRPGSTRCRAISRRTIVNPLNINPLKDLIERFVDFEALRAYSDLQIFISATNVQTGRVRIFPRQKITAMR